ncbi:hypothetical protein H4R21_004621 [Coemansia helicoidea]|uniref:Uncharacterized protein n=1 Tax=Coemansia helicoidea TaxID=1286919 RepID=A0ACC1KXY2_9FUNG|nr:hypothetical protein H4R21_004621 [Coemansia helicoidea]
MAYSLRALKLVVAAAALAASARAALGACSKDIALRITNVYENSDVKFHYDYCENIKDGRGFTAGIAGFCTGTADAWEVIQEYHKLTGGKDAFSPMDRALAKLAKSGSASTSSIKSYCKVWSKLGLTDPRFRRAQDTIRDRLYFVPSQKTADKLGLQLHVSRSFLYDTGIQHGTGDDRDGLDALIARTNKAFTAPAAGNSSSTLAINGKKVDEVVWLKKFIKVRQDDLKNPREAYNRAGNAWAHTVYRIKSYAYIVSKQQYMFSKTVHILDNDGARMDVNCGGVASFPSRRRRRLDGRPLRRLHQ